MCASNPCGLKAQMFLNTHFTHFLFLLFFSFFLTAMALYDVSERGYA